MYDCYNFNRGMIIYIITNCFKRVYFLLSPISIVYGARLYQYDGDDLYGIDSNLLRHTLAQNPRVLHTQGSCTSVWRNKSHWVSIPAHVVQGVSWSAEVNNYADIYAAVYLTVLQCFTNISKNIIIAWHTYLCLNHRQSPLFMQLTARYSAVPSPTPPVPHPTSS